MKILIYAMARTHSSAIATALSAGGNNLIFEPFHPSVQTRLASAGKYGSHAIPFIPGRRCNSKKWVKSLPEHWIIKTLVCHHDDVLDRVASIADLVLLTTRDDLECCASRIISQSRRKWLESDTDPTCVRAKYGDFLQYIDRRAKRQKKEAAWIDQYGIGKIRYLSPSLDLALEQTSSWGIPTGSPTTHRCRDAAPSSMIENLETLQGWFRNTV